MILQTTYLATAYYIDTDIILYGYDNTGLSLVLNQDSIINNSSATLFESNTVQAVTLPTYANFVTETAGYGFFIATHATLTAVCVNAKRIQRLEVIDSSNTTIYFELGVTLDVNESMANMITFINRAVSPPRYADEDIISDGSGVVTLAHNYISGTWSFFLRGTLVRKTAVTETGANELTTSLSTKIGDFINVKYQY